MMEYMLIFITCSLNNFHFNLGGNFNMIIDLFINACILITFISVYDNFFKDKVIKPNRSVLLKTIIGVWNGSLGIMLMIFSVHITPTVITDFRTIPIVLSAIYGGIIPSIISAIMVCFFRTVYFGVSNTSIISAIAVMISGIGFGIISIIKESRKDKWIHSVIYLLLISIVTFVILIEDKVLLFKVLVIYCSANLFVAYFSYRYTEYLAELVEFYKKLKNEATIDFLTDLNNVRQFDKFFNNSAKQTIRKGEPLSLLFLDIDHFKKVNDTYGHSSGDIILKGLADILRRCCRSYDIVSRNGGEEFSAILLDCSALNAIKVAEKIREQVETHEFYIFEKLNINVTVSIGVCTYPDSTINIDNLLSYSDNALYEAKRGGRNKVVLYKENYVTI